MSENREKKDIKTVVCVFLEGENQGSEIRVNPPRELVVGRSEDCDIFLSEKKISRKHCKIHVTQKDVILEDLGSTNGTLINRKQVKGTLELHHEDMLQVGTSMLKLLVEYQQEAAPIPEQEPMAAPAEDLETKEEPLPEPDFESQSGVMPLIEEASLDIDLTAMTREQNPIAETVATKASGANAAGSAKAKPLSGDLSAMSVADLLQNLSQNNKSGVLSLKSFQSGEIFVMNGRIVDAKTEAVSGRKALFRMLSWNQGEFELLPLPSGFKLTDVPNPLEDSVENLLMEGFQKFDELEKLRKKLPPLSTKLKLKYKLEAPLAKLHPRVLDVLQDVINYGHFQSVLDFGQETDLEISKMVYYLIKKEYIEIIQ